MKNIDQCKECFDDYCYDCRFQSTCNECLEDTCGSEECITECKDDCGEMICKSCESSHNCKNEEE